MLSADGSRLFFLSPDPSVGPNSCSGSGAATSCPPQLYVREESSDGVVRTRWVSRTAVTEANGAAAEEDASLMPAVRFEGATPDGDKVFFRTAAPLTADDPNGGAPVTGGVTSGNPSLGSVDLFMYDFPDDPTADPSDGQLSRISRGPTGASDGGVSPANTSSPAGVDGAVRFLSQDGARVLFTSATPLPGVAAPSNGTITSPGSFPGVSAAFTNLYLYENVDGAPSWKFVARVPSDPSGIDSCASTAEFIADPIGSNADNTGLSATPSNCVRGTAGGELITFLTRGQLVLDDPDSSSLDVYGYDAEDGELVRISAAQGGAGGAYQCIDTPAPVSCHGDLGFGGRGSDVGLAGASGGRAVAFFQTKSRLVVEDTDLEYDVYQWERGGLSLLTPGTRQGAYLADNTADGRSVFFQTRDRLTWQDTDDAMDVYVARAGGGIPQPPLSSACVVLAGGCHDGGAGVVAVAVPETAFRVGDGDVSSRPRRTLTVGRLSRRALRIAARTGVLRVSVGVSDAGRVTAVAKARIGKRFRRVARGSVRLRGAGRARLRLSLDRVARQRIRHGRALRLTLRVSSAGARPRAMTVRLPGVRP